MTLPSRRVRLMGTYIDTTIDHPEPEPILDEVERRLRIYEHRFSANDDSSELMQVNHQAGIAPVQVAPDLFDLIELGKVHSIAAGSRLNITIGPLIQTWRVGFDDARLPTDEEIKPLLDIINPQDIVLDKAQQTVFLAKKRMKIDLGALAKGYIADLIMAYLKTLGVRAALINLGGNVLTYGSANHNPDKLWKIGIQHPRLARGNNCMIIKVQDCSVVTSGIYERTFTFEGKTYHHIFDSQTGYPVDTDTASITIVSPLSVEGEIWTTRLFGKSTRDVLTEIEYQDNFEALVITKEDQMAYTSGFRLLLL